MDEQNASVERPEPEQIRVVVIGGSGFDFPLERAFPVLLVPAAK